MIEKDYKCFYPKESPVYYNLHQTTVLVGELEDVAPCLDTLLDTLTSTEGAQIDFYDESFLIGKEMANDILRFIDNAVAENKTHVIFALIETHMNLSDQMEIMETIIRKYNNIKFIVVTNSPFIIQGLVGECYVYNATTDKFFEGNYDSVHESLEDITEDVLGIKMPQRSRRAMRMAEAACKYYELLNTKQFTEEEKKAAYDEMDKTEEAFGDIAYRAFLRMERCFHGKLSGDQNEQEEEE